MGSINGFRYRVDYGYRGDDLAYVILQEARTNWPATSELEILIDDKTKERTYRGGIQFPGKPRQKWSELRGGFEISDRDSQLKEFKLNFKRSQLEAFLRSGPREYSATSLQAFLKKQPPP